MMAQFTPQDRLLERVANARMLLQNGEIELADYALADLQSSLTCKVFAERLCEDAYAA